MRVLIKNILSFSRSAESTECVEETDLNLLIEGILSDLEISIAQKNAVFHIGELPTLRIIPERFRQLFQNLIINALKFSRENTPPEIHIYAVGRISPEAGDATQPDYYDIYVKDNGIGFEQKYADEIFTLFKRLNSKDRFEGTGIGLSICKKIVEQHNGNISASSNPGVGTTFTISLPAKENSLPLKEEEAMNMPTL